MEAKLNVQHGSAYAGLNGMTFPVVEVMSNMVTLDINDAHVDFRPSEVIIEDGKRQYRKVGVAGSFINQMMGNNDTRPIVGDWVTFLHYSDRSVGIVESLSEDGLTCVIREYDTSADIPTGMTSLPYGHECWKHDRSDRLVTLIWKKNAWCRVSNEVVFEKSFVNKMILKHNLDYMGMLLRKYYPNIFEAVYAGHVMPCKVVKGITRAKKSYYKVSVIFGVCDYHYDWSF